jgi:hypothetical protein
MMVLMKMLIAMIVVAAALEWSVTTKQLVESVEEGDSDYVHHLLQCVNVVE